MKQKFMQTALEDNSSGKANLELEYTLYCKIKDFSILKLADYQEDHEQWEVKFPKFDTTAVNARMRVRKTTNFEGIEYVQTTKTKVSTGGETEVGVEVTEDSFKQFKLLAPSGMLKRRFVFAIRGTDYKWEVDVYFKEDGTYQEYCKIDLEVKEKLLELPPLPGNGCFTDVIYNQYGQRTKQEIDLITTLHDTVFSLKNQYI
jgi:hypothetical protein